jgi:hypothetical protein
MVTGESDSDARASPAAPGPTRIASRRWILPRPLSMIPHRVRICLGQNPRATGSSRATTCSARSFSNPSEEFACLSNSIRSSLAPGASFAIGCAVTMAWNARGN